MDTLNCYVKKQRLWQRTPCLDCQNFLLGVHFLTPKILIEHYLNLSVQFQVLEQSKKTAVCQFGVLAKIATIPKAVSAAGATSTAGAAVVTSPSAIIIG